MRKELTHPDSQICTDRVLRVSVSGHLVDSPGAVANRGKLSFPFSPSRRRQQCQPLTTLTRSVYSGDCRTKLTAIRTRSSARTAMDPSLQQQQIVRRRWFLQPQLEPPALQLFRASCVEFWCTAVDSFLELHHATRGYEPVCDSTIDKSIVTKTRRDSTPWIYNLHKILQTAAPPPQTASIVPPIYVDSKPISRWKNTSNFSQKLSNMKLSQRWIIKTQNSRSKTQQIWVAGVVN